MGLLSRNYGNLDSTENIFPNLPQIYDYTTSLVAVIQRDENTHGGCGTNSILGCCADAYQVVTILKTNPDLCKASPGMMSTLNIALHPRNFFIDRIKSLNKSFLEPTI